MAKKRGEVTQTKSVDELIARLNKQFGKGTALGGYEAQKLKLEYFSTGSFALDVALRGGFPYNRIIELIGAESSCKTSVGCHLSAKAFLDANPDGIIMHVDLENSVDFDWMAKLRCDLSKGSRIVFVYADSGEQAGNIIDEIVADAGVPVYVIVDSIMALVPLAEMEAPLDQKFMGVQPALINRILRVVNARIKRAKVGDTARTTMLLVNQTRDEIGANKYSPTPGYSAGGQGRKFFTGQRIVFTSSTPDKEQRGTGDYQHTTRYGKRIHFNVIKNKCGGPEETGHFMFYNRCKPAEGITYGVDDAEAVISQGLLYEVLRTQGNSILHGKKVIGGSRDKAILQVRKLLNADSADTWIAEIKTEIMEAAKSAFSGEKDAPLSSDKKTSGIKARRIVRFAR